MLTWVKMTYKIFFKLTEDKFGKPYSEIFSSRLRELRLESAMNRAEAAQKIGVALSTYGNWEQGRRYPSVDEIYKILKVFGVQANDLFEF